MSWNIPILSISHSGILSGSYYGAWQSLGPIPANTLLVPGGLEIDLGDARNYANPFGLSVSVQFAKSDDAVVKSISVGSISSPGSHDCIGSTSSELPWSVAYEIAKCRYALSISNPYGRASVVSGSIAAGTLATDFGTPEVDADDDDDLPLHRAVTLGLDGREIRKLRYRFTQEIDAAGDWSGTPMGEAILRRLSSTVEGD